MCDMFHHIPVHIQYIPFFVNPQVSRCRSPISQDGQSTEGPKPSKYLISKKRRKKNRCHHLPLVVKGNQQDVQLPIFHLQKGVVFLGGVQHHDLLTDVLIGLWCHFSVKTHLKSQRKNGNHADFARKSDMSETFGL